MLSSSSTPQKCPSPFSNSMLIIPSNNYSHTMKVGPPEPQGPNPLEVRVITVELQVQQWYKLYVEPTRGCRVVTLEDNYLVSPKFTWKFKFPLFHSASKFSCELCINGELDKLPISHDLGQYLKPFIVSSVVELAQPVLREFKLVFDVKAVKIDLVNHIECDHYRRRGLV
ncbi:hypothetical protein VNO78_02774 [Psophocarpus tetragonolobus]|uniref:Uncharacterized protein n=1 Tax=Psophocarpus tetragonolobus TaxID=3891 RepID=A0AAN9TBC9_PSOTE